MFKKKESHIKSSNKDIPARFVKKDGYSTDGHTAYSKCSPVQNNPTYENVIPELDISESYVSRKQQICVANSASSSTKGVRRKFAPAFLSRKKKNNSANSSNYENVDAEEDVTDIAFYEDLVSEQESINPVMLGQLDDSQLSTIDSEPYEKLYKARMDFVLNNYRKPPPYPGTKQERKKHLQTAQLQSNADTPLMRQLLKDKSLNDNTSMNNYVQATPAHRILKQNSITSYVENEKHVNSDQLVNRTQYIVSTQTGSSEYSNILNASELYEKRKQYYMQSLTRLKSNSETIYEDSQKDTVSAIYPAREYDLKSKSKGISQSVSVPNLSTHGGLFDGREIVQRQPRSRIEPAEMEALIAHYRKTSLDSFEPYEIHSSSSESVSLYSEDSPSYVPPSPYLNAAIPEWLQVYAKASPELDKYLQWHMFRHAELDCWQTMLKRLYKKELEQVVLWFEEYRHVLQEELEHRENSSNEQHTQKPILGFNTTRNLKKTEV